MNSSQLKENDSIEIGGMLVSSLEFHGNISLVIFTAGCMLRCPYCHNPDIINGGEQKELQDIYKEIEESLEYIDSVVLTGGEPLIQYKEVKKILNFCKKLNLNTKLDTNGYYPELLEKMLGLVDYVAIDVKAPFNNYKEVIGADIGDRVKKSIEICSRYPDTYLECRTTYVPGLLEPDDIIQIAREISCDLYTIQQFRNRNVLDEKLKKTPNPSRKELLEIAKTVKPFLNYVKIKTSEFGDEIIE